MLDFSEVTFWINSYRCDAKIWCNLTNVLLFAVVSLYLLSISFLAFLCHPTQMVSLCPQIPFPSLHFLFLPVSFQTFDHLHTSPVFFPTKTQSMSVAHHLPTPPLSLSPLLSLSFSLTNRQHWQWSGVGHGETSARGPWAAAGSDQVHKEGASVALQRLQKREIRSFIEMFCHKGHFFWDVISLSV